MTSVLPWAPQTTPIGRQALVGPMGISGTRWLSTEAGMGWSSLQIPLVWRGNVPFIFQADLNPPFLEELLGEQAVKDGYRVCATSCVLQLCCQLRFTKCVDESQEPHQRLAALTRAKIWNILLCSTHSVWSQKYLIKPEKMAEVALCYSPSDKESWFGAAFYWLFLVKY